MDHFRTTWWLLALLALLFSGPLLTLAFGSVSMRGDWRTATHRATGLAPDPSTYREAVVQVYASRTFGWRGAFAVHTWLAAKPKDATRYTRYEVIGWYAMRGGSALSISDRGAPDAEWYGAPPWLVRDVRGADAQAIIDKLPAAASSYPYAASYTMWPGPNSNTFIAHLGRELPELRLTMPSMAIGKDYLPAGHLFARAPSGTGYQMSLSGVLGLIGAIDEGLEVNLLGLVIGIDFRHPGIKLPGIDRWPANS
jgi:Protein of unknown function (DUF3750)